MTETDRPSVDNPRAFLLAVGIFAILSLWVAKKSDGFLEADACTHYQYARWCWQEPSYLVNVWGRPFCTAIYAIPAILADRAGTKTMCLLIALATAALTWRIAVCQKYRWPALAGIFVLAQPLVFLHSFSELTELPFAMLLAAAFLMYCQKRFWAMAIIVSLMPLARPEGFAFLLLAALALILHRKSIWLFILVIPLVVWSLAGAHLVPDSHAWWRWLPDHWPYAEKSVYQSGPLLHFVALLPVVISPLLFPFMLVGIWRNVRSIDSKSIRHHRQRCNVIIALISLAVLAGHSWLYWRGEMASNGEVRYMLVVAPLWALLTERGWEWCLGGLTNLRPFLWAGIAAILPIICNFIYPVLPLHFDANWQHARELANWYEQSGIKTQYPRILAAHPGITYFLHVCPADSSKVVQWGRQSVQSDPPGVVLIWDDVYSLYNADADLVVTRQQVEKAGWQLVRLDDDGPPPYGHHWAIYVSAHPI